MKGEIAGKSPALTACSVFAIPGICGLIIFLLVRPQEFFVALQHVPFLHLFAALAVIGWVIDIRIGRLSLIHAPALPWVVALLVWMLVSTTISAPDVLVARALEVAILFAIYATIAHGVQTFHTFQVVAGTVVLSMLFITGVCFHQGLMPKQCIGGTEWVGQIFGEPDGRLCDTVEQCGGPAAEPDLEYRCEHVGTVGTYSIEERVRYRGELMDPNEVALAITAGGLSLLIAFTIRKRGGGRKFLCIVAAGVVIATVFMTKSRGGLVAALIVPAVYVVRRFGLRALIPAAMVAVPVLLFGTRGGEAASTSTEQRYDAWSTGLDMFHQHPFVGVGMGMFREHHYLTAHNSFVLALAELGFPGLVLFAAVIYGSIKALVVGLRELSGVPGAAVARVWGLALLAAFAGIVFQINTLSFTYHSVLWIFLGLVGAWCSAIRHHRPEFMVRIRARDLILIVLSCASFATWLLPLYLRWKGFR